MKTTLVGHGDVRILECLDPIASTGDALEFVSACIERDTARILLDDRHLPAAFFELRSGFAGELIQKLLNYRMKLAVVFGDPAKHGQRFEQFVLEARRGRAFRVFDDRASALAWLGGAGRILSAGSFVPLLSRHDKELIAWPNRPRPTTPLSRSNRRFASLGGATWTRSRRCGRACTATAAG